VNNPWKKISSREVYKNPWISLREDQVINPSGNPGIYSVIETRIATGVVAIDTEDKVILVGQYRYPTDMYSWEIPEGGGEDGESPLDAAKRELLEETGVVAANWRPLGGEIHLSNCYSSERAYLFLATELTFGAQKTEETEKIAVKKVPFSEVLELVDSGGIKDGLSIIAILRAARARR
jgi:8-oxo-dGTP pyrophosphatase MutT (NUDIX family)